MWEGIPWGKPGTGSKNLQASGSVDRGQTGLPANFRQKAPEIHGSLVSPRRAPSLGHRVVRHQNGAPVEAGAEAANTTGFAVIGRLSKYSAAAISIDAEEVLPKRWMLQ